MSVTADPVKLKAESVYLALGGGDEPVTVTLASEVEAKLPAESTALAVKA